MFRSTQAVRISNSPPNGIASRAFNTRFMITCSNWSGSAWTAATPGFNSSRTFTFSPARRASNGCRAVSVQFKSSTIGRRTCFLPYANNCPVNSAALSPALRILSRVSRSGSVAPKSPSSNSV